MHQVRWQSYPQEAVAAVAPAESCCEPRSMLDGDRTWTHSKYWRGKTAHSPPHSPALAAAHKQCSRADSVHCRENRSRSPQASPSVKKGASRPAPTQKKHSVASVLAPDLKHQRCFQKIAGSQMACSQMVCRLTVYSQMAGKDKSSCRPRMRLPEQAWTAPQNGKLIRSRTPDWRA